MPRCYMVKKGAPRPDNEPPPCSPTEASVAPPDEQQAHAESPQDADTAAEYAELRSALVSERSAADTEAAHELLSLAAGVPPLPPAAVLTVLRPPPIIPVYTYTLQPTAVYIVSDDQPEPMYHAVQVPVHQKYTMPRLIPAPRHWSVDNSLQSTDIFSTKNGQAKQIFNVIETRVASTQEIEYTIENPHVTTSYITYPDNLPPPPPLQYHPPPVIESEPGPGTLTTLTIEEVTTDSEPELLSVQVPVIEPVPQQQIQVRPVQLVQSVQPVHPVWPALPPPPGPDADSEDEALCIVAVKEKQAKYDCNECGKRYATSSNLSRHKQTHRSLDSNSARKCVECGKAYVSMPALAMHVLTHRMGHVCGVCGKQFSRPWLLRGHVRSHTGEKPYNCASCGKAFADRSNLRAHLQTHSSDKKYECARCKKSFALKSYLNKHQEAACTRSDEDGAAA